MKPSFFTPDSGLIHVTHFNRLMWNSRRTSTCVIAHGVVVPDHLSYRGELRKGLVIVNHLRQRGRRLDADLFDAVRARVPLDLVGMDSLCAGGMGEIGHDELPEWMCRYRFVFHPIRYTSLGLALCEAMGSASRRSPSPRPRRLYVGNLSICRMKITRCFPGPALSPIGTTR